MLNTRNQQGTAKKDGSFCSPTCPFSSVIGILQYTWRPPGPRVENCMVEGGGRGGDMEEGCWGSWNS